MVVGTAKHPRAFLKKTGFEHAFDYQANKKAWMTTDIFFSWLQRFESYISKTLNRKALLSVDNSSANGTSPNVPVLPSVRILFLPPKL